MTWLDGTIWHNAMDKTDLAEELHAIRNVLTDSILNDLSGP